jgi:diguanylate cyclase (GGDEF)-like protein
MQQANLAMMKESPEAGREILQEDPRGAPLGWSEVQQRLANDFGMSLLLVKGHQPPALVLSNNNSICQAIQSSPAHVGLCDPYCGEAHRRALEAGETTHYRCHAGLHCFAMPVQLGRKKRELAVIGGRAFLAAADYSDLIERFRTGDLQGLLNPETFSNVIFSVEKELEELAAGVAKAAGDYSAGAPRSISAAGEPQSDPARRPEAPELKNEIKRLRNRLEHQSRFTESLRYFLERISSTDPEQTYLAILMNSKKLLQAERASLLVFDETRNELTLKAAVGISAALSDVSPMRLGEGISGGALQAGQPIIVRDLDVAGIARAPRERRYKTKSFISYPITIGGRKVGILNLTDKTGGGSYDEVDLSLLEIIAPQVALALERAEWQEKAAQFQLMSITDPLTGLPNRRYLEERLMEEVNRSKRYEHPMSCLMIDIDDFKLYNDLNGHQAGDLALQMTAQALKSALRSADVASRYGGEEFCILLPQTTLPEAGVIAERIREKIESTSFPHARSQPLGAVTISIGMATFSAIVNTAERIIWAADRALYEAKSEGKNQIRSFKDPGFEASE